MGNGKDGGEGAAERIHYIICVPLFCLSSYGRLISLTLMQPQLSRAPVELWVMKPAFTNREINTWLPGNGNKLSPSVSLSLLRTHSHFLCPPPFVTLYLPHALTFLHPLFSPSSSSSSLSICFSRESKLPRFPVYLLIKERVERFYSLCLPPLFHPSFMCCHGN